jgi:hypothetical protein
VEGFEKEKGMHRWRKKRDGYMHWVVLRSQNIKG